MPIWLRKFTFNEMQTYFTDQAEKIKAKNKPKETKTLRPDIEPSYSSKASKK